MDIKGLIGRVSSARYFKLAAIAVGVLSLAVAGGAYYFLVYQPQEQSNTPAVAPPVAKKPQPAPAKPAVFPPATAASAVPAVAQHPAAASAPAPAAPTPDKIAQPAKPEPVQEPAPELAKHQPEMGQPATMPEQVNKPDQMEKAEENPEAPPPAPAETREGQKEPGSAGEPSVEEDKPDPHRRGIMPKYNDLMTAVLRGDIEATRELLDLGWWVDKPGENGTTPLMAAVMNRDTEMVKLLLDHGAEPTAQALSLARKNWDAATASLLEQKGAR